MGVISRQSTFFCDTLSIHVCSSSSLISCLREQWLNGKLFQIKYETLTHSLTLWQSFCLFVCLWMLALGSCAEVVAWRKRVSGSLELWPGRRKKNSHIQDLRDARWETSYLMPSLSGNHWNVHNRNNLVVKRFRFQQRKEKGKGPKSVAKVD